MPLNSGRITLQSGNVIARIYYDTTFTPVGDDQPLVNGPRGFCLDLTNVSGAPAGVTVISRTGVERQFTVGVGDPVTTGPASGRSRTAAQMSALGLTTRGDVSRFSLA